MFTRFLAPVLAAALVILPVNLGIGHADAADMAKVKFKSASGEMDLVGSTTTGTLSDASGKTKISFLVSSGGKVVEIVENGKASGYLVLNPQSWKIDDASKKELYALKKQGDGDYKLKDAAGQELFKIKAESYGYKIEDAQKKVLYKVHGDDEKMTLKSADGNLVLSTKSKVDKMALASYGLDKLTSAQKAVLAYAFSFLGGK